ncbi:MAG: T9SS type A sorting domain-containing protein [Winogradskyella sp.]|uniref:T9SS type A sorting domain-containing protein n=1 Tax=Winogradskyella sp. TaxID=1883156 RepID=UPI00385CEBF0
MKYVPFIVFTLCLNFSLGSQELTLETPLDPLVHETSGILFLNNTLITHNDSANTNQLYDIDVVTGNVTRTVTITNATNGDWEDLTHDDTYIYIGDFGNFDASRTDLRVYRILISDYFSSTSVTAEVINFSYSSQTSFTPSPLATNFDAEGLIHINNKLYIFSKNWLNGHTDIYELPKTIGTYSLSAMDTINTEGLISGATFNPIDNSIMLIGYGNSGPFFIHLKDFHSGLFSNGTLEKIFVNVPTNYSPQIEGIIAINADTYYVSAEAVASTLSGLYSFNASTLHIETLNTDKASFYPNPASDSITVSPNYCITQIYSITGKLIKRSSNKTIDISDMATGIYIVKIQSTAKTETTIKKLIIN